MRTLRRAAGLLLSVQLPFSLFWSCASAPETPWGERLEVHFRGNESIPDFRLMRVIQDLLIEFANNPTRESAIQDAAIDLREHYLNQGFPDALVEGKTAGAPRLTVEFQIVEGPRAYVTGVDITGNVAFSADELLRLWNRQKSGVFATGLPWFVEDELRSFAAAMRSRYRSEGYLEARIDGPEIKRAPGAEQVAASFHVEEGLRYHLIDVTLDPALPIEDPRAMTAEFVKRPYSETAVSSLRLKVRKYLEDAGYPDPVVRVRTRPDHSGHTVSAVVQGDAGHKGVITAIEIRGRERTSEAIIRRRIRFREGEAFHGGKVDDTVQELYLTGLFTKVLVAHEEVEPGKLKLVVDLEEAEAREIALLVGYGSYEGARVGAVFTEHNLFGWGQRLTLGVRASPKSHRGDLTWTEPQLFATRTQLSVTTFAYERQEPSFTDQSVGVTAALSRKLLPHLQGRFGYALEQLDGSDIDPSITATSDEKYTKGTLFLELSRDTRDSPVFPTQGHQETFKIEHSDDALGGTLNFDRIVLKASANIPVAEAIGFCLAAQSGVLLPYDPGLLPIQERFFNGGESTVRSFRESQLGPTSPNGDAEGGEFRNVFNAEARFPLFGPVQWAVFGDAGNVGRRVQDYGLGDMRYAVGGGIRFALPIGPLRLDFGYNPDRRPGEDQLVIHFSIGYPF